MSDEPILVALARLESRATALHEGQTSLSEGQTGLRVELMARMDRLDYRLTEIQDAIRVNTAAAQRAYDNTR